MCCEDQDYPMGEFLPEDVVAQLLTPIGVPVSNRFPKDPPRDAIRMIPNGPVIPMDQVKVGESYGPLDLARDCGCEYCQEFLAQHEGRQPQIYTDMVRRFAPSSPAGMIVDTDADT